MSRRPDRIDVQFNQAQQTSIQKRSGDPTRAVFRRNSDTE